MVKGFLRTTVIIDDEYYHVYEEVNADEYEDAIVLVDQNVDLDGYIVHVDDYNLLDYMERVER